jgi:hypothetical protein
LKCLLTILIAVIGAANAARVDAADWKNLLTKAIEARSSITSLRAKANVKYIEPPQFAGESSFLILCENDNFRTDKTWAKFTLNASQQGDIRRTSLIGGKEGRRVYGRYGADVELVQDVNREVIAIKWVGLFCEMNKCITALLKYPLNERKETIFETACTVAYVKSPDGTEYSAVFDEQNRYRGCRTKIDAFSQIVWIGDFNTSNLEFPAFVYFRETNGPNVTTFEEVSIFDLEINPTLSGEDFDFSGLGLKAGGKVTVRNKVTNGKVDAFSAVWNGTELIPEKDAVVDKSAFWWLPSQPLFFIAIGAILVVAAFFVIWRKGQVAR